jgi:hypothetical protein
LLPRISDGAEPAPDGEPKPEYFTDQFGTAWCRVWKRDHYENLRLRGKAFRHWLVRARVAAGERPSRGRIAEQLDTSEAFADENRRDLHNRSAWLESGRSLCIDLADAGWRIATVTPLGWEITTDSPVLFRRFVHQVDLPEPDASGDLREFLNLLPPLHAEADRILVLVYAVAALVPMPRPILMPLGPQGSGKSTLSALLRRLVDPSRAELLGRDARADMPQTFYRHAVPVFDNADSFTNQESDLFCQAVTGRAIDRRQLYTNDDEYLLSFIRPVIINGLRPPTNRPDLLDRSLIIELDRLTSDQRRYVARLEAEFHEAHPRLFGGLLNALTKTLERLPSVPDNGLSRMADFHRFGRAAAGALGFTIEAFDVAMHEAEARQRRGAIDSPLATAILLFARKQSAWKGELPALLERLADTAKAHQIRRSPESWPETPIGLGRQLKQLSTILAEHGVTITRPRTASARLIRLAYDAEADQGAEL